MKLQAKPFVTNNSDMAKTFLSKTQVAARLGITPGAFGSLANGPEPDVIVGEGPRATRGWTAKTIDDWNESRPGSGNWGNDNKAKARKSSASKAGK